MKQHAKILNLGLILLLKLMGISATITIIGCVQEIGAGNNLTLKYLAMLKMISDMVRKLARDISKESLQD